LSGEAVVISSGEKCFFSHELGFCAATPARVDQSSPDSFSA